MSLLQQETAKLSQAQSVISEDPFGNDEDEEETYANEVIIDSDMDSASEEDSEQNSGDESNSSDESHDDE